MKTIATIEARMGSSRLPGKVLLPLAGEPALFRMVERVRRSRSIDDVVIATTTAPADDTIAEQCARREVSCFRGSEEDVLLRVLQAGNAFRADLLVELTGDCPLIDPGHIDDMVSLYRDGGYDYVFNRLKKGHPTGFDVQVFSVAALDEVEKATQDPIDRTHVSCYFYHHPEKYRLGAPELSPDDEAYWPEIGVTLDEPGDYLLLSAVYDALYPANPAFTALDVLRLLRSRPELLDMNRHVRRKRLDEG